MFVICSHNQQILCQIGIFFAFSIVNLLGNKLVRVSFYFFYAVACLRENMNPYQRKICQAILSCQTTASFNPIHTKKNGGNIRIVNASKIRLEVTNLYQTESPKEGIKTRNFLCRLFDRGKNPALTYMSIITIK